MIEIFKAITEFVKPDFGLSGNAFANYLAECYVHQLRYHNLQVYRGSA